MHIHVANQNDVTVTSVTEPLTHLTTAGNDKLMVNGTNLGMYYNAGAIVRIRGVGNTRPANQPAFRAFPDGAYDVTYVWPCVQVDRYRNLAVECTTTPGAAKDLRRQQYP